MLAHRTASLFFLDVPAPYARFTVLPHSAGSLRCVTLVTHCDVLIYRDSCTCSITCFSASDPALTHRTLCPCMRPSIHPSIDLQLVVAGFLLGTPGANECPAGLVSVGTEAECTSAATTLGYTFVTSHNWDWAPKGCFLTPSDARVYFNPHETGAAYAPYTPICAGACSGTRSFVCVRVSVHVCVYLSQCCTTFVLPFFCCS